jgi:hypothetical protein
VLVELFRNRSELSRELLRDCAGIDLPGTAEAGSVDLSRVVSAQYLADHVTVVRDDSGAATAAVISEIQLAIDDALSLGARAACHPTVRWIGVTVGPPTDLGTIIRVCRPDRSGTTMFHA